MAGSRRSGSVGRFATAALDRIAGRWWIGFLKQGTYLRPRLTDLRDRAAQITTEAHQILAEVLPPDGPSPTTIEEEFRILERGLADRLKGRPLRFPENWATYPGTLLILYGLVRAGRPETVVETGVANGVSSFVLLEGLRRNGQGRLVSFDTSPDAGGILEPGERSLWTLHVLPSDDPRPALDSAVRQLPGVDLAFLDADHSYPGQMWEYEVLWERMRPDAWLVSDDVDWSFAFLDFCGAKALRPRVLVSESKASGLVRVPAGPARPVRPDGHLPPR